MGEGEGERGRGEGKHFQPKGGLGPSPVSTNGRSRLGINFQKKIDGGDHWKFLKEPLIGTTSNLFCGESRTSENRKCSPIKDHPFTFI